VNNDGDMYYIYLPHVEPDVAAAGSKVIQAFGVRERFFHIELFKSNKTGKIMALEVNMRPPGAWMTDAINFSYDMDVYKEWANMVVQDKVGGPFDGRYFVGYASLKKRFTYRHTHQQILERYGRQILASREIESVFSRAMGNFAYLFRSESLEQVREIINFIQAKE
jgi:hypothetical protein